MTNDIPVLESSGNVFADLGLPDAEEALTKAELAMAITAFVQAHGMTQIQAADVLGISQPKVSALLRGQLTGFSMERLLKFLNALGHDVRIVIDAEERPQGKGTLTVIPGGKEASRSAMPRSKESKLRKKTAP